MQHSSQIYHPATLQGLRIGITGGTSGLGQALVQTLTASGAQVAFVARHAERVAEVESGNPGSVGIVGDVARKLDTHRIALQMLGRLGGLDVLINNASDLGPIPLALLGDTDCEDFERALQTNVLGPFRLTKAVLGALAAAARAGRGAVVLSISSDAAVNAYPTWGAYGATKAALAHMSRIWNEELAVQGVRFLALDPGDMDTPMHAAAVPDADRTSLLSPQQAAIGVIAAIVDLLPAAATDTREVS